VRCDESELRDDGSRVRSAPVASEARYVDLGRAQRR
jgi:hypothetical protein